MGYRAITATIWPLGQYVDHGLYAVGLCHTSRCALTSERCGSNFNTLRPRQNCRHLSDDIFKCIFLNDKFRIPLMIWMEFVPLVRINNIPALVQIMAWRRSGDKPLSEQWWSLGLNECNLRTHVTDSVHHHFLYNIEMPQNTLYSKLTLVQVMTWCRPVTSHYLSHCWPRSLSLYGVTRPRWENSPKTPIDEAHLLMIIEYPKRNEIPLLSLSVKYEYRNSQINWPRDDPRFTLTMLKKIKIHWLIHDAILSRALVLPHPKRAINWNDLLRIENKLYTESETNPNLCKRRRICLEQIVSSESTSTNHTWRLFFDEIAWKQVFEMAAMLSRPQCKLASIAKVAV